MPGYYWTRIASGLIVNHQCAVSDEEGSPAEATTEGRFEVDSGNIEKTQHGKLIASAESCTGWKSKCINPKRDMTRQCWHFARKFLKYPTVSSIMFGPHKSLPRECFTERSSKYLWSISTPNKPVRHNYNCQVKCNYAELDQWWLWRLQLKRIN